MAGQHLFAWRTWRKPKNISIALRNSAPADVLYICAVLIALRATAVHQGMKYSNEIVAAAMNGMKPCIHAARIERCAAHRVDLARARHAGWRKRVT